MRESSFGQILSALFFPSLLSNLLPSQEVTGLFIVSVLQIPPPDSEYYGRAKSSFGMNVYSRFLSPSTAVTVS